MVKTTDIKKNKYKANKPNALIFGLLLLLAVIWLAKSFDIIKLAQSEIEWLQTKFTSFSSISQLIDDGSIDQNQSSFIKKAASISKNSFQILFTDFIKKDAKPPEEIKIFIKFKHLQKIYDDRSKAISKNINVNPREVPCKISDGKHTYKCKVNLKGDLSDHWNSKERMSLRIKIKDGFIYGLQDFSIQKPRTRQFPYDQVFHDINSDLNRISSDSQKFYKVIVNGKSWGMMNIEPLVDQKFLEIRDLKRLGIFRFSNQKSWEYRNIQNRYKNYFISDPTVTLSIRGKEEEIPNDPIMHEIFSNIYNAISNKNNSIFNREKMVGNLVLCLAWGSLHPLDQSNSWYTWNPYEKNLEPILTDQTKWSSSSNLLSNLGEGIGYGLPYQYRFIFQNDPISITEISAELEELKSYFKHNSPIAKVNNLKENAFPNDKLFHYSPLLENINYLEKNLSEVVRKINNVSRLYKPNLLKSEVLYSDQLNHIDNLVRVIHYQDGKIRIFNLLDKEVLVEKLSNGDTELKINQIIPPSRKEDLTYLDISTSFLGDYSYKIKVTSQILGISKKTTNDISLLNVKNDFGLNITQNATKYCNQSEANICKLSGNLLIDEHVTFNQKVIIEPGTKINLSQDVDLIFDASVDMIGDVNRPIFIEGKDSGGIFIKNRSNRTSSIKNTIVKNLGVTSSFLTKFTGSFNGYGGIFNIENLDISNGDAEDQLNLVNAMIDIKGLKISQAFSDAFDCDFCKGVIQDIHLYDVGGDGLDVSGSNIKVLNMNAELIKDKALSVGERSIVSLVNAEFINVGTGVAAKDSSQVVTEELILTDIKYDAFMTYVKKPFFIEETSLIVNGYKLINEQGGLICVREENTDLFVNSIPCEVSELNVDELYTGRMKKY